MPIGDLGRNQEIDTLRQVLLVPGPPEGDHKRTGKYSLQGRSDGQALACRVESAEDEPSALTGGSDNCSDAIEMPASVPATHLFLHWSLILRHDAPTLRRTARWIVDSYNFAANAPVIDIVRYGFLPVDWSSLDRRSARASRLFSEARSYDTGPHGLTIPIRGPRGERCLFFVTSNLPKRDWSRLSARRDGSSKICPHQRYG